MRLIDETEVGIKSRLAIDSKLAVDNKLAICSRLIANNRLAVVDWLSSGRRGLRSRRRRSSLGISMCV